MQELIEKIEQWAEDRNIIKGSKPIDQAMKLFSEFGELADNVGKGRDCRDDIGDVLVVLTIMLKQQGRTILGYIDRPVREEHENIKFEVGELADCLAQLTMYLDQDKTFYSYGYSRAVALLGRIARHFGYTLQECIQIAYNDIKERKGAMYNGVFIKESDPAYQDILDNIEADKRMASQKRISVNIEDL